MDGPWVGVEPKYVTVFPHAINHGATWDLDLVARLANATGNEMRAASQIRYRTSGGQAYAAVICDSGPLANTAHHPAWGRISETYGEDPVLVSRIGSTVTSVMQARDAGVLRTALTTRHYMGYHKTNTMPVPTMEVSERDLYDAYLPGYHAFAVEGGAEGIMCGFSSFDGIPSCANSRLLKVSAGDSIYGEGMTFFSWELTFSTKRANRTFSTASGSLTALSKVIAVTRSQPSKVNTTIRRLMKR